MLLGICCWCMLLEQLLVLTGLIFGVSGTEKCHLLVTTAALSNTLSPCDVIFETLCHSRMFSREKINTVPISVPGCKNKTHGALLKELMQTNNFRVTVVEEYDVVEICGALKVSFYDTIWLLAWYGRASLLQSRFANITVEQHGERPLQRGSMWQPGQLHDCTSSGLVDCAKKRKLRSLVTFHHSGLVRYNPSDVWERAATWFCTQDYF